MAKWISKTDGLKKLQRYCAYQDRCHQEVRQKLLDLGIYGDDLEHIIADLIEDNFLNEERFARSYARGKFRMKQWGRSRIKRELKQRKISDYCIRKAMEEIEDITYLETLEDLIIKKLKLVKETEPYQQRRKVADHLIRKGYEVPLVWDQVIALIPDKPSR